MGKLLQAMDMFMAQVVVMVSFMYTYLQIHQIVYINIYSFVYVKRGRERETDRVRHDPSCSLLYLNKGQCGHMVNLKSSAKPLKRLGASASKWNEEKQVFSHTAQQITFVPSSVRRRRQQASTACFFQS